MQTRTRILILLAALLVLVALLACGPGMMSNDALIESVQNMTW